MNKALFRENCKYCFQTYNQCYPDWINPDGSISAIPWITYCPRSPDGSHEFRLRKW